jgi:hypothetical protein
MWRFRPYTGIGFAYTSISWAECGLVPSPWSPERSWRSYGRLTHLPVREYARVEPVQHRAHQRGHLRVHLAILRCRVKHLQTEMELEFRGLFFPPWARAR